jgi:superfamily I DNA and/or RNA helicase/serine/threonine protein kinase
VSDIQIIKQLYHNPQSGTTINLVRDKNSKEDYVIKWIHFLDNPIYRAIFDKEIGALKKVRQSDNIVKLLDHKYGRSVQSGQAKGSISLEYVDGDTLQNICGRITSITDKYSIIKQLISALRCAHENGIIHRDVNPNNIMLTNDLHVKLIDFGICKIKGMSQKGSTYQYATNKYAAPEVSYNSANATEQSDIYSLGAVIYYMFTKLEPPLPSEFAGIIQHSSGIDPSLKDILLQMTAYNAKERFENMIDLEIALAPLYNKYLNYGEVYYVLIDSSKIGILRRNNLVQSYKTDEQLMKEDIAMNFSNASVRCEEDGDNINYIFDGINYSIYCSFNDDKYQVYNIKRLQSYYREKNRKLSLSLTGQIIFYKSYSGDIPSNNNFQLSNRLYDHMQMLRSKKNIDSEYVSTFGFWYDFIKIMTEDAQKQAPRLNYRNYQKNEYLNFELCMDSYKSDENLTSETKFIYENKDNKGTMKAIELGTFAGYVDDGNTILIKPTQKKKKWNIPKTGTICIDYRMEIAQYKKQERALDEFRRDETSNSHSLKGIFVGLEPPSTFPKSSSIQFFDSKLDDAQKRAVCKIIDANDIALIQGPPGTGKTNVIIEVIRQIIHYNKRNPIVAQKILIVSQSHAAVDKILEDLDLFLDDINVIRIGNDDDFSELVKKKYSLENRKKTWIQKITINSKNQLLQNLDKMKIKYEDFHSFADALENIKIKNNSKQDITNYQTSINSFYESYQIDESDLMLQQQITCYNWIKQLSETRDIEEYFIKNAIIVFGTCSGFASNPYINDTTFDYVIVDEAAKATLPEIMISLVKSSKVVLVGDQMQLPPVFDQGAIRRADKKIDIPTLKNGGFGKIFDILPDSCRETLSTQYRMHPCIGDMISTVFYDNKIQNGVRIEERTLDLPSFSSSAMLWISTSNYTMEKRFERKESIAGGRKRYSNPLEVTILLEYIKKLDDEIGDKKYSVGVITPYRAQLDLINKRIKMLILKNIMVETNTVDAFQGSQRDIILYSTVRSSDTQHIGFLEEYSRLNVSFSRAKSLLIIIGDLDFLNNIKISDNRFPNIIRHMLSNQSFCHIIQYRSDKK